MNDTYKAIFCISLGLAITSINGCCTATNLGTLRRQVEKLEKKVVQLTAQVEKR